MKLEHMALNVDNPPAMADWYSQHLGMRVLRAREDAPYTRFLADSAGCVFLELYRKPEDGLPDYRAMPTGRLHLGFLTTAPEQDRDRLLAAGAALVADESLRDGSRVVTFRDPWGFAFQISQRTRNWV